ncbi:histone acetyltransferase subunit NuA4-domain-containing protein [Amylocarpus encephaloides]|uniref:Chromatin modification-related protein EAF6 n=1 Tax=Amylocarpus encephaloides TaxID=45428 RepID=A0A9P8C7P4_9HELO|nr:histone acetyltransferase subunit NuA4-domain-containing protein [Amylocarpus encephaloides]
MSENTAHSTAVPTSDAGLPYYEKSKRHLKLLLERKHQLEKTLAATEDNIYKNETEYLEETPAGNIIVGFENYTKGMSTSTVGVGGRRGGRGLGVGESNRVFSRGSVSFGQGNDSPSNTAQSTPMATMAPTPLSTSFAKGEAASNHATPTSASSASRNGAGAGAGKKNKKAGEDSDGEGREVKKVRTNFGAVRKN